MNFISTAWNWIWGKNTEKYFFNNHNTQFLGQSGPIYLDTAAPYKLYNSIPQLKGVIDKKALMFANMDIKLQDIKSGEFKEDKELMTLLQNPNILQGMNDWLRQYKQQEQVYGNQFIYKNKASRLSTYPTSLQNIPPSLVKPNLTGKLFDQISMDGLVANYEYIENKVIKTFETNEILWSRINDLDNPLVGISPLKALQYPLTNTKYAYDRRNVLLQSSVGILSRAPQNGTFGEVAMKPEERKKLNDAYMDRYGIGIDSEGNKKSPIHVVDVAMNWQPMTYATKELMLFEEVEANLLTIVDHFGLNINIFSSKSQTYENVKNAIIQCYQDTIQPEADQFMQSFGKFLGVKEGMKLVASYEHLAILKKDQNQEALTFQTIMNALNQAVTGGILSKPQALTILQNTFGIEL